MRARDDVDETYFEKVLKSALNHPRRDKRMEMIYLLGELRDLRAMDALASIMTEDDPYLVSEAVKAAGKMGGVKAMEQLQIMTHHRSFLVRGEVAKAIGSVDNPDLSEMLDQLLKDISPYVEECAHMALAAKKTKERIG